MDGKPYTLGERTFIVPRLRVAAYYRALEAVDAVDKMAPGEDPTGKKALDVRLGVMLDILKANYPDLTAAELAESVSVAYSADEMIGLMRAAGARDPDPGGAVSPSTSPAGGGTSTGT